jgi:hypothetical protein
MAKPNDMNTEVMRYDARRAQDVREEIQEECAKIEDGYMTLAQRLLEVIDNGYFTRWGFSSFEEYCTDEVQIGYRKASYLVQIAQTVKDLKIDWEDITGIGWTRMRTILPALKQDGEVGDWLTLAADLSVKDLEKLVKDHKIGATIEGDSSNALVTIKFRVTKDQFDIISDALDLAKEAIEDDNDVLALEQMCYDYFMASGDDPNRLSMENMIKFIEKKYAVNVTINGRSNVEDMINEEDGEVPTIEV